MLKLQGKITISRMERWRPCQRLSVTSTHELERPLRILITDSISGCVAAHVSLSLTDFALALTGMGYVDCDLEFNDSGVVGMVAENKTELVPIPAEHPYNREAWSIAALAPFEVDGWKAREGDITNGHNFVRTKNGMTFQRVVFFRHVPRPQALKGEGSKL